MWHAWSWKSHCYMVKFSTIASYDTSTLFHVDLLPKLVPGKQATWTSSLPHTLPCHAFPLSSMSPCHTYPPPPSTTHVPLPCMPPAMNTQCRAHPLSHTHPAMHTPTIHAPCQYAPLPCIPLPSMSPKPSHPQPEAESQTDVQTLPCTKLRLRALKCKSKFFLSQQKFFVTQKELIEVTRLLAHQKLVYVSYAKRKLTPPKYALLWFEIFKRQRKTKRVDG